MRVATLHRDRWQNSPEYAAFGQEVQVQGLALRHRYLAQQATTAAYRDYFMSIAVLGLVIMPLVFLIKEQSDPK